MDVILWACEHVWWAHEREQMNQRIFLGISYQCRQNIIWHIGQNIWWHGKIFYHRWMNNFIGWKIWWEIKWMNFQMNIGNKIVVKIWTKETRWRNFMLGYLETYNTWNVDAMLQVIFHISLKWSFATSKPFKILN